MLIVDEIHLLGEERGVVIEEIVTRTKINNHNKKTRIVGLSATLPNYKDVGEFISA